MGVEPDDAEPVVASRQALDCANVNAATTSENDRTLRKRAGEGEVLLAEGLLVHDAGLRIGERQVRRLRHCLAARSPGARYAHERSEEGAAARVTFVRALVERNRGERAAVRTTGPQARH
jgi:hypothetical protein